MVSMFYLRNRGRLNMSRAMNVSQPLNYGQMMTPTYQELQQRELNMRVYIETLRETIHKLGQQLHVVRCMNAQMAKQPPPAPMSYIPPPPRF